MFAKITIFFVYLIESIDMDSQLSSNHAVIAFIYSKHCFCLK